ncbi:MAG: M48 family metallopeptidase [Bacteroidota bacterium]
MRAAEERFKINIAGTEVPVRIVRERRRSIRAFMGKDEVIMRFPHNLSEEQEAQQRERLLNWLKRQHKKRADLFQKYQTADYQDGDTLRVGERQYTLVLQQEDRKTNSGRLNNGQITLKLVQGQDDQQRSKAIRTLLSRIIGADFLPAITQRVYELNDRYFQKTVRGVKLKYNHSNWGSCSNTGNINLSTRLLFAPQQVVDYVIIHELAHLIHLNHSHRFWAEVARAMPNYEEQEVWLKKYGAACDF